MPRRKPTPAMAITSLDEADAALAEIARVDREITAIDVILNDEISAAKKRADDLAAPYRQKREQLEAALTTFATAGKEALFKKGKKSLKLIHGVLGFRASDELKPATKVTWKMVLENLKAMASRLKARKQPDCIHTTEKPDKEALRKLPEDLQAEAGVRIVPKDVFYYVTREESVAEKAA